MVLWNNLNELRLHFTKKNEINVRFTFRVRVPRSLVAGCILSKCPDGRRCPLTLKGMVGYILHLPEMSFWCLCASQHSRIEWFAFEETKGHMHTVHFQKHARNWHNIIKNYFIWDIYQRVNAVNGAWSPRGVGRESLPRLRLGYVLKARFIKWKHSILEAENKSFSWLEPH